MCIHTSESHGGLALRGLVLNASDYGRQQFAHVTFNLVLRIPHHEDMCKCVQALGTTFGC